MKRNLKRWVGAVLGIILVSNCGINIQAAQVNNTEVNTVDTAGAEAADKEDKEMTPEEKQKKLLKEALDKKIETNEIDGWPQGPKIYGESAIVMDMQTGAILYGKGIDEKRHPASITKILTALVALENSSLTDTVNFSEESIRCLERGYSHIGMKPGETITMKDALHALMLASANEVAYAIGETVGGTNDNFVRMMNEKAKELGCKGTHFINTNGMFQEDHYTTARDMALISREAFQNQELLNIVQTMQYTIPATETEKEPRTFQQKHKMMTQGKFFDSRCIGGKTGYTDEASNTLVTVMKQDDVEMVAVVLKAKKDIYPDTKKICDYAFENFERVNIAANEKSKKLNGIDGNACVTLPKGMDFKKLDWEMSDNSHVNYSYKGQLVGTAKATLKVETKVTAAEKDKKEKKSKPKLSVIIVSVIIIIAALGGGFALHKVLRKQRRKKLRREKRRRKLHERRRRRGENEDLWG